MSRLAAALAAVALLAGCTAPWMAQARAFTTGFKAGQTLRYDVHTVLSGSLSVASQAVPLSSDQTLREILRVTSVDRSGTATVEVTITDLVAATTGGGGAQPSALLVGRDGRIHSGGAATLGGPIPSIPGSDQLTPVFAGHPVKPGDGWIVGYDRPNPYGGGSLRFTAHGRYLRDESAAGRQAAVIQTTLTGPIDFSIDFARLPSPPAATNPPIAPPTGTVQYTGQATNTATYWVDLATNQVLKSTGSGTYVLAYSVPASAGVAGAQQVTFNGTIKTDLAMV